MNRSSFFAILIVVAALQAFSLDWPQNAVELKKIRHDNFELRAYPAANAKDFTFALGTPEADSATLFFQNNQMTLRISDGTVETAANIALDGKSPLIVRRHGLWLEILTPTKRLVRVPTFAKLIGQSAVTKTDDKPAIEKLDYQRLEPFAFGDDFMRTEEEAKQWGVWTPVSGEWKIYSVMERIHENPAARIREGYEPVADRSPNPFCLSATAPQGEAVIVTGYDFWCDYEASVSIKPFLSQFGLIFGYLDEKNFNRIEWNLPTLGDRAADLKLISRVDGNDNTIQAVTLMGRSETWWKLAVRLYGNKLQILLDDAVIMSSEHDPRFIGGKIGLYAKGANETFFDDVEVKTITEAFLEKDICKLLHNAVLSANPNAREDDFWHYENKPGSLVFLPPKSTSNRVMTAIGYDDWQTQRVKIELLNSKAKGAQGLAVGNKQQFHAIWTSEDGGQIQLRLADGDSEKTLVALPFPWNGKTPLKLAADTSFANSVTVWANGKLMIRHPVPAQELGGKVAILADSPDAQFTRPVLFAALNRDWEQTVDIARFANDPFMQGWASSRYAWIKQGDKADQSFPQTHIYTGDLYGAFTLNAPIQPNLNYHFGADDWKSPESYLLKTELDTTTLKGTITLLRGDKILASSPFTSKGKTVIPGSQIIDEKIGEQPRTPDTDSYGKLSFQKDGHAFWASIDGVELFCVHDDKPLTGRSFAVDIPAILDFIHLELKRESLKDYLFEKAETDWIQLGRWQVTNRFACDPRWSHMNGESKGTAALWSKFDLDGDYTIECFAGMRMRQGEMLEGASMSYPRVGDINVALDGDGHELFSGYNLIVSAWDAKWSEKWTQFWRRDKVVTQSDAELIPRNRFRAPVTRAIAVDYDPGGRPVHGAWYALKIRKTGNNYDVWFDNTSVFSFNEKSPLEAGRRIALWTQHNSIVLARVKINYRHFSRKAPLTNELAEYNDVRPDFHPLQPTQQEELPALKITSSPRLLAAFCPFSSWNGDQSAEIAFDLSKSKNVDGQVTDVPFIFRNANSGGDFGAKIHLEHVDLLQITKLEFDFQASPNAFVNLYFSIFEDPSSRYFITLTGPDYDAPNLYKIDGIQKKKNNEWSHVSIDLNRAIHAKYPWHKSWTLKSMMIGMLHEGYLNAGLNGNQRGATYMLRNLRLSSVQSSNVATRWLVAPNQQPPEYRAWFATTDDNSQKAPESTAVWKDITHFFKPASPDDKFLIVETKQEDGTWKRFMSYERPQPASTPLVAEYISPKPGQPWGGNPIVIQYKGPEDVVPILPDATLHIDKQSMNLNSLNTVYDSAKRTLTITPQFSAFSPDSKELTFTFLYQDCVTLPAVKTLANAFVFDRKQDKTPPSRPIVKDARTALAGLAYPALEATTSLSSSKVKLNYELREDNQLPAVRVTNTVCGADSAVRFHLPSFSANAYPILSFDYNIPSPDTYIDFSIFGPTRWILGMTDHDKRDNNYVELNNIQADGKWHRQVVGLDFLRNDNPFTAHPDGASNFPVQGWIANVLAIGNFYYSGTEPGSTYSVSNVRLAQIATTVNKPFVLNWSANDPSGIAGYSYVWDDKDDTIPDTVQDTAETTASFDKMKPFLQYFHIRAVDTNGNWGPAAHYMYYFDDSIPKVVASSPTTTSKCAPDSLSVTFNNESGAMNFTNASLTVNGTVRTLNRYNTQFDPHTKTLTWNMLSDNNLLGGPLADGAPFIASLKGVRNITGVEAPPVEWSWNLDFSQDKTPPLPPAVSTMGTNAFRHVSHYSPSTSLWKSTRNALTEIVTDEITNSSCIQISVEDNYRRFLYTISRTAKLSEFPFLYFRYRLMPGTNANLFLNVGDEMLTIKMNGSDENVKTVIGNIPDAKDDGQWHQATLNLRELIAKALPDKKEYTVSSLVFGDYKTPKSPKVLRIDDLSFVPELSPFQLFYFSSTDATGIASFNADLVKSPEEVTLRQLNPKLLRSRLPVEVPDSKGIWYLAAQAQDCAGNLSETVLYPFYCSQPAVSDSKNDGLEYLSDGSPWRVRATSPKDKRTYCYSRVAKTGQGNTLLASQFIGYANPDVIFHRRIGKTLSQNPPKRLRTDLFADTNESYKISAVMLDENLAIIVESEAKTIKADGAWHRKVIFNLPEYTATPAFFGFRIQMQDKSRAILTFDNIRQVKIN